MVGHQCQDRVVRRGVFRLVRLVRPGHGRDAPWSMEAATGKTKMGNGAHLLHLTVRHACLIYSTTRDGSASGLVSCADFKSVGSRGNPALVGSIPTRFRQFLRTPTTRGGSDEEADRS